MSQQQNTFSDRKISNTTMVSTSLNGPINKQKNSIKMHDKNSIITKKESTFINQNSKEMINMNNEYYKLEKLLQDKKIELDNSCKQLNSVKESYVKKLYTLEQTKNKYKAFKDKNLNLKLMIMNLMKSKNLIKDK